METRNYRPLFHVNGGKGWINDPNGFCYFKGKYGYFIWAKDFY